MLVEIKIDKTMGTVLWHRKKFCFWSDQSLSHIYGTYLLNKEIS